MNIQKTPFAAIAIAALTIVVGNPVYGASIVKATYSHNDNKVAQMIYTGSDGGPNSNRAIYWKLLGKAPESAYEVKIKPDEPGGKVATLAGDIIISVEIRNKFSMGTVKTDKLTLVRDDVDSTRWYIPAKELTRIVALIDKESAKHDPKAEQRTSSDASIAQAASSEVDAVSELSGTSWILKSWSDKNLDAKKYGISASFSIVSGKSSVHGQVAPNGYSAVYESKADGSFSIGTIASTERISYDEEILYFRLLPQVRKYAISGNHLILSSKEGKELLVFERKIEPVAK